ncbi:MAG: HNH endonuclease [Bacteroidetes bacterium]|nr:HNH endonuclease [Bacteroidota bacterium]MBK7571051.1 HNH endonuclease [Bacteroidota bacterium]MBP6323785.1 HNH endonuclease [Chitinophagales bacterium]
MFEKLPFVPGQLYNRRSDIHHIYGGNYQSGICPCSKFPYIFIFSGKTGRQHGYKDEWLNTNIFSYTGEGQIGDMKFTKGNLALRDHLAHGKRVFLFYIKGGGVVEFVDEVEFEDVGLFETHDSSGETRIGIKFFFKRKEAIIPRIDKILDQPIFMDSKVSLLPNVTERSGLVTSRVGQGAYRKSIIYRWENKCAVTGFDKKVILIASHIVPWAKASDFERLDVENGILLSPTYDALFDRYLISFENSGKIVLSDKVEPSAFKKIGVTGIERILNPLTSLNKEYLERHMNNLL